MVQSVGSGLLVVALVAVRVQVQVQVQVLGLGLARATVIGAGDKAGPGTLWLCPWTGCGRG